MELARANSSIGHQRLADSKSRVELQQKADKLETKVEKLEGVVKALKEREKESRDELERWMKDEKSKEGSVSVASTIIYHARYELMVYSRTKRDVNSK